MARAQRENLQMKVPALLHLSRLGYRFLSRNQLRGRDRLTNILPDALRASVERINHVSFSPEEAARLMADLQAQLDADDLGKRFYGTLRTGWHGLKLIDFAHPENNLFQSAAELVCGSGAGSFRPDLALFINGFPLAMIELKRRNHSGSLQAEFDRMLKRFRSREGRRYLQCTQVWAFSDDHADNPDQLQPAEGAFFATVMAEEFPVYAVRDSRSGTLSRPLSPVPEEEARILQDNGFPSGTEPGLSRRSLSPNKPTHRMLTILFSPDRLLFLLRYGIQYIRDTDAAEQELITRRMLTIRQLSLLRLLIRKAARGFQNWSVPASGAAGEAAANASVIALLRDLFPGALLYWIAADDARLKQDQTALQSCGVLCAPPQPGMETQPDAVIMITGNTDPEPLLMEHVRRSPAGRRVYILSHPFFGYMQQQKGFSARLRRMDPNAILITRTAQPEAEKPVDPDGTILGFSMKKT